MGDHDRVDLPQLGQLADVGLVVPVAEAREVAVGAGLAGVLRRRLAVHLEDAAAGPADHAADQVEVVDLAGGRGRAHRLVDPLERGGQQPLAGAEEAGGLADLAGRDPADAGHPFRVVRPDRLGELVEPDGVGVDERPVGPAVLDHLVQQPVEQGQVGPGADGQVDVGLLGDRRSRIRDHSTVWVAATLWPTRKMVSAWSTSV